MEWRCVPYTTSFLTVARSVWIPGIGSWSPALSPHEQSGEPERYLSDHDAYFVDVA
jgi:hypothetical protein